MACSACGGNITLSFSNPFYASPPEHNLSRTNPPFQPWNIAPTKSRAIFAASVSNLGGCRVAVDHPGAEDRPKFRWVEIGPKSDVTEEQRMAISSLPEKMTKRCKAFMRQVICFSVEKGSLVDLLTAWARIMKPRRADWLAVLKQLKEMDHPLYIQVANFALSEELFEATVRDYTKIIHLYAKHNRLQDAENTLLAMQDRGMVCDQVTLTTMIHMYSKAGYHMQAEEIFNQMKCLDQPLDKRSYGSMIMSYIRAGMLDKGEALLVEMATHEIYAGREVYKALLRAYSTCGETEGAQRVFDWIQFAGTYPDAKVCALLINSFVVAGDTRGARTAFNNMLTAGVEPSDKCVALLLAAYEKENKLYTALDFLMSLEKAGIMVGKESSEILVQWFRKIGVMDEVANVLKHYVQQPMELDVLSSSSKLDSFSFSTSSGQHGAYCNS